MSLFCIMFFKTKKQIYLKYVRALLNLRTSCCLQIAMHKVTTMAQTFEDTLMEFKQEYFKKKKKKEFAIFCPCGAHSLNRIGVNTAKLNHDKPWLLGIVETTYPIIYAKLFGDLLASKTTNCASNSKALSLDSTPRRHWYNFDAIVLSAIDQKNVKIQNKGISLIVETQLIKDLIDEMKILRD
ncbi:hypothetical protein PR048_029147 [Dryococelus australis]|uniref:DUF659 domain-containing protein n=1 Tax=Dryococelus australis TaxID=614101 RepID=A0ABQ9GCI9_9NEOP|nr:hypothetical protein PR048_029147 [Dryococelus australis]